MSQENVETVRRMFTQLPADPASYFAVLDPDVEFDTTSSPGPYAGIYRGHEAVRGFMRHWLGTWADYEIEADEVIDAGDDLVVVVLTERGRGRGSGVRVQNQLAQVWTMRDGKAIRINRYSTRAEALEAVGLREQAHERDT